MRRGMRGAVVLAVVLFTGTAVPAHAGPGTITFTDRGEHVFVVPQGTTSLSARAVGAAGGNAGAGQPGRGGRGAAASGVLGTTRARGSSPSSRPAAGPPPTRSAAPAAGRPTSGPARRPARASAIRWPPACSSAGGGGGASYAVVDGGDAGTPGPAEDGAVGPGCVGPRGGAGGGATSTAGGAGGAAGNGGGAAAGARAGTGGTGGSRSANGNGGGGGGGGFFGGGGGGGTGEACDSGGGGGGGSSHASPSVSSPAFVLTGDAARVTFTYEEATPPVVTIADGPSGEARTVSGTAGTDTGDDGNVLVVLLRGGAEHERRTVPLSAGAWSTALGALPDGEYVLEASQVDAAGNRSAVARRAFRVGAVPPGPMGEVVSPTQTPSPTAPPPLSLRATVRTTEGARARRRYGASCRRRVAATVRLQVAASVTVSIGVRRRGRTIATKTIGVPAGRTVIALCLTRAGLAQLRTDRRGRPRPFTGIATIALSSPSFQPGVLRAQVRFRRR